MRPPKSGEQSARTTTVRVWRGGTLRTLLCPNTRLLPELNIPSVRYLTQQNSIFDLCCADDTLFGVMLLSESWDAWEGVATHLGFAREAANPH
jgi:hypothetical protein